MEYTKGAGTAVRVINIIGQGWKMTGENLSDVGAEGRKNDRECEDN